MTTMLRPIETSSREVKSLNGLWRFAVDDPQNPEPWKSVLSNSIDCPVPASYNDIFVPNLRNYQGKVWYQRDVRIPSTWTNNRLVIRVDAATHAGVVYANDTQIASHIGGYLPFDAELDKAGIKAGDVVRLTISVDNELTHETIPPGQMTKDALGNDKQEYWHDFFNYAGLARSVKLCSLPKESIEDITIKTDIEGTTGVVRYDIVAGKGQVEVQLLDKEKRVVASGTGTKGSLKVDNANLWQPGEGYLYTLRTTLTGGKDNDEYLLPIGIRTVRVEGLQILINNKPFYFRGYGRHEDTPVRGKGHDDAFMVHDFELMKWTGANSFRTSHYPYAEEVMDYADAHGWVVIDETPAVGLNLNIRGGLFGAKRLPTFSPEFANDNTREAHANTIRELIKRDKNRPGVVSWCITNEPDSEDDNARAYFEPLCKLARELDDRPLTFTNLLMIPAEREKIGDLFDIISLNRYYGWYRDTGDLPSAEKHLDDELHAFTKKFNRPLLMLEYGADTMPGLRSVDGETSPWTEEFQVAYYNMYHKVFDRHTALAGEQVWNFADFSTGVGIMRVGGNKKGIFTRDRQPKSAAFVLKARWEGKGGEYHK